MLRLPRLERSLPLAPGTRDVTAPSRGFVRRALSRVRHGSRQTFDRVLARLVGRAASAAVLDPSCIRSVLVCRINGRLGNALLLVAMLRQLHELLPHAAIDLAIAHPEAHELLAPLPGVRRIVRFPHGSRLVRRYLAAVWRLRRQRYDLALDPAPSSTGGRIVLALSRARLRAGFAGDAQWAPLTHAVPAPPDDEHRAVQPMELVARLFGVERGQPETRLWLPLPPAPAAAGRALVMRALAGRPGKYPMGFFAHATGSKRLDAEWWRAFLDTLLELEPLMMPLEFLPLQRDVPIDARVPCLRFPSLPVLAGGVAATRLFVATDAGPMHLAGCTPVPTVGLFRATDPALYRPLKPRDLAICVTRLTPQEVANRVYNHWRTLR